MPSSRNRAASPTSLRQRVLLVVLAVHEHEVRAVAVKVGGIAPVDGGGVHLHPGVERLVDDLAREHVLQLGAHERRTLARFDVLELGDCPQLAVDYQDQPVLEVSSGRHVGLLQNGQFFGEPGQQFRGLPGGFRHFRRPASHYQCVLDADTAAAG